MLEGVVIRITMAKSAYSALEQEGNVYHLGQFSIPWIDGCHGDGIYSCVTADRPYGSYVGKKALA